MPQANHCMVLAAFFVVFVSVSVFVIVIVNTARAAMKHPAATLWSRFLSLTSCQATARSLSVTLCKKKTRII